MPERRYCLAGVVLLCLCGAARAHRLNVFAGFEDGEIRGYAYFPGGARARGVTVEIRDASGEAAETLRTDRQGAFAWRPDRRGTWTVVAQTPDGHRAKFVVSAADAAEPTPDAREDTPAGAPSGQTRPGSHDLSQELAGLRAELRALRRQVAEQRDRRRVQDIVGGIGYFIGLAGIAMYALSRRRKEDAGT